MTFKHWHLSILSALGIGAIAAQSAIASGQIIEANGRVLVRRGSNASYEPAAVGTILEFGDLIWPDRGVRVRVRCSDGTNPPVTAGAPSGIDVICHDSSRQLRTGGRGEADFLAVLNGSFIYATQVQNIDSLLQWQPFPEAQRYSLRIDACDDEGFCDQDQVWQQMIDQASPRYDGTVLQSEHTYQLTLTTADDQGRSQTATLRFRLISETEAARIQTEIAALESQDLSPDANAIARANIYQSVAQPNTRTPADMGLVFEAIATLEDAVNQGSQTPYLHRLLGDSYLQVGLLELAKTSYAAALDYAQSSANARDRAAAQVGLATIAAAQGQLNEAEAWLQQAKIGYTLLGDTQRVEDLQKYLQVLDERAGNS